MSSPRVINATLTGRVGLTRTGNQPCLFVLGSQAQRFAQSGVRLDETLQIVFGGVPPFNLSQSICDNSIQQCWCGITITTLTTNTFNWTVKTINSTSPALTQVPAAPPQLFVAGQSIVWSAVEQRPTAGEFSNFTSSANFTLGNSSYDNPRTSGSLRLGDAGNIGLIGWAVMFLAMLGVTMGV